jgi:hypothetical protein
MKDEVGVVGMEEAGPYNRGSCCVRRIRDLRFAARDRSGDRDMDD